MRLVVSCYYDGANLNAVIGLVRPEISVSMESTSTLHKTFSTPRWSMNQEAVLADAKI